MWSMMSLPEIRLSIEIIKYLDIQQYISEGVSCATLEIELQIPIIILFNTRNSAYAGKRRIIENLTPHLRNHTDYNRGVRFCFINNVRGGKSGVLNVTIDKSFINNIESVECINLNTSDLVFFRSKIEYLMYGLFYNVFSYEKCLVERDKTCLRSFYSRVNFGDLRAYLGIANKYKRGNNVISKVLVPLRSKFDNYPFSFDFATTYSNGRISDIEILFFPNNPRLPINESLLRDLPLGELLDIFTLGSKEKKWLEYYQEFLQNTPLKFGYKYNPNKPIEYDRMFELNKTTVRPIFEHPAYIASLPKGVNQVRRSFSSHMNAKKKSNFKIRNVADSIILYEYLHSYSETQEELRSVNPKCMFSYEYYVRKEKTLGHSFKTYYDGHSNSIKAYRERLEEAKKFGHE